VLTVWTQTTLVKYRRYREEPDDSSHTFLTPSRSSVNIDGLKQMVEYPFANCRERPLCFVERSHAVRVYETPSDATDISISARLRPSAANASPGPATLGPTDDPTD